MKNKFLSISNVIYFLGYTLFFLMLFLSSTAQTVKAILLAVILIFMFFRIIKNNFYLNIDPDLAKLYLMLFLIGLVGVGIGMINQTPGYMDTINVYIIYPLLYLFIVESIQNIDKVIVLFKVLAVTGLLISLYILSFVFVEVGIFPDFLFIPLGLDERLGIHSGYIGLNMNSLTSIIYIFPFIYSLVLSKNHWKIFSKSWNKFILLSFIFVLIISIISGRRSLWVIMLLSVISHYLLMQIYKNKNLFNNRISLSRSVVAIAIVIVISIGFSYLDLSLVSIIENILEGFNSSKDHSADVKSEQFYYLMKDFAEKPLFGSGHGAGPDAMMHRRTPWGYELSYVSLLYHTGIIGVLVYTFYISWIFYKGIVIISTGTIYGEMMIPVLVATSSFMIANTVNPYLEKFDFIWIVLFMPVVIINLYLRSKRVI